MASALIEDAVVKMVFDNSAFDRNISRSITSLNLLKKSSDELNYTGKGMTELGVAAQQAAIYTDNLSASVDNVAMRLSTLQVVGMTVINELTRAVMRFGSQLYNQTLGQIKSGGFARAMNIENAKFQLEGLGVAWNSVYDDIMYGVKDTAYGLDEAAVAASQLIASNVTVGDSMKQSLRAISGVAAMTNSSYSDIAHIFTTAASMGRVMSDQLDSLAFRGLNARSILADALGTTEAGVREMTSQGKLDFQTFAKAMDDAFGDHAKEANKTFNGALSNMKAALSRMGADFATPYMNNMRDIFNALTPVIDSLKKAMGPLYEDVELLMTAFKRGFQGWAERVNNIDTFSNVVDTLRYIMQSAAMYIYTFNSAISETLTDIGVSSESIKHFAEGMVPTLDRLEKFRKGVSSVIRILNVFINLMKVGVAILAIVAIKVAAFIKQGDYINRFSKTFIGGIVKIIDFISDLKNNIDKLSKDPDINPFLRMLLGFLKPLASGFEFLAEKMNLSNVAFAATAVGVLMLIGMFKKLNIVKKIQNKLLPIPILINQTIRAILGSIKGLFGNLSGAAKNLKKYTQDMHLSLWSSLIKDLALSVFLLASALTMLTNIPTDALIRGSVALGGLMAGLVGMVAILNKIKPQEVQNTVGERSFFGIFGETITRVTRSDVFGSVLKIAASIAIMTASLKALSKLSWEGILKGLAGIAGLGVVLAAVSHFTAGDQIAKGLAGIGLSLLLIGASMKVIATMDIGQIVDAIYAITAITTVMTIFARNMNKLDDSVKTVRETEMSSSGDGKSTVRKVKTVYENMLEFGKTMVLIAVAARIMATAEPDRLLAAVAAFGFFTKFISSFAKAMNDLDDTVNESSSTSIGKDGANKTKQTTKTVYDQIMTFAKSLLLISAAFKVFGTVNTTGLITGVVAMGALVGIFVLFSKNMKKLDQPTEEMAEESEKVAENTEEASKVSKSSSEGVTSAAQYIMDFAKSMVYLSIASKIMSTCDFTALMGGVTAIAILTYIMERFAKGMNELNSKTEEMTSETDTSKSTYKAKTVYESLIDFAKSMILMSIAAKIMSSVDPVPLLAATAMMSILIGVIYLFAKGMNNLNQAMLESEERSQTDENGTKKAAKKYTTVYEQLIELGKAMILIGAAARLMATANFSALGGAVISMGVVMFALYEFVKAISGIKGTDAETSINILKTLGKTILMMGGIVAVLTAIDNPVAAIAGAAAISMIVLALGAAMKIMGRGYHTDKFKENTGKELMAFAIAILGAGAALMMLKDYGDNWTDVLVAALAISGIFAAFAASTRLLKKIDTKQLIAIGLLSVPIISIAAALRIVAGIPTDQIIVAGLAIGILAAAMTGLGALIGYFQPIALGMIVLAGSMLAIAAAAALFAGAVSSIINSISNFISTLKEMASMSGEEVDNMIANLKRLVRGFGDVALEIVAQTPKFVVAALAVIGALALAISSGISIVAIAMGLGGVTAILAFITGLTKMFPQIADTMLQLLKTVTDWLDEHYEEVKEVGKKLGDYIKDGIWDSLGGTLKNLGIVLSAPVTVTKAQIGEKFATRRAEATREHASYQRYEWIAAYQSGAATAEQMVAGLNYGIENGLYTYQQAMDALAEAGLEAFQDRMDINSPSKEMIENGDYTVMGLVEGIKNGELSIVEVFQGLAKSGIGAFIEKAIEELQNFNIEDLIAMFTGAASESTAKHANDLIEDMSATGAYAQSKGHAHSYKRRWEVEGYESAEDWDKANSVSSGFYALFGGAVEDAIPDTEDFTKTVQDATRSIGDMGSTSGTTAKEVDNLADSIEKSLDVFSEFNLETSTTSTDVLANFLTQIVGVQRWSEELSSLSGKLPTAFLETLAESGPQAYDQIHALYSMTDAELTLFNKMYAAKLSLQKTTANDIRKSFQQKSSAITNSAEALGEKTVDSMAEGVSSNSTVYSDAITGAVQDAIENDTLDRIITEGGGEITEEMAEAIAQGTSKVVDVWSQMGYDSIEAFKKLMSYESALYVVEDFQDNLKEAVSGSISIFDEVQEQEEISAEQMLKNMKEQVKRVGKWATNLKTLAARGISDELLAELESLGPEGAAKVQAFVDMTDAQLKQANQVYEHSLDMPDYVSNKVTSSFAAAGRGAALGFTDEIDPDIAADIMSKLATGSLDSLKDALAEIGDQPSLETMKVGVLAAAGLIEGVEDNIGNVYQTGNRAGQALVDGMKDAAEEALETVQEDIENDKDLEADIKVHPVFDGKTAYDKVEDMSASGAYARSGGYAHSYVERWQAEGYKSPSAWYASHFTSDPNLKVAADAMTTMTTQMRDESARRQRLSEAWIAAQRETNAQALQVGQLPNTSWYAQAQQPLLTPLQETQMAMNGTYDLTAMNYRTLLSMDEHLKTIAAQQGSPIYLDTGALVGYTVVDYNTQFGRQYTRDFRSR